MQPTRNKCVLNLALLCFAAGMASTLVGFAQAPDFASLTIQLRTVIAERATSDDVLREAISRLGRVTEPPSFWTQIANSTNYSRQHRIRAVFALFRRHGESCGDVLSLGKCLEPAKWLDESSIERVTYVFGHLPIELNEGESVYSISVLDGPKIYIRMPGDIDRETFNALLRGKSVSTLKKEPTILQCGYGDDYDEWFRAAGVPHKGVKNFAPPRPR